MRHAGRAVGAARDASPVPVSELVEITDHKDRPLAVMPAAEAHRQMLRHRVVLVALHDARGRVYLQRRGRHKRIHPGRWDLSAAGHVRPGEAREEAALRELREELGVTVARLVRRAELPATPDTAFAHVTLFSADLGGETPRPNPEEVDDGMFVDADELHALLEDFRELLTPALIWAAEHDALFRFSSGSPEHGTDRSPEPDTDHGMARDTD